MEYRIKVQNADGEFIGEFNRFRNLRFGKRLNNYGQCNFEIPVSEDKALVSLRRYTVWIYRDDELVWAGEQALRRGELRAEGDNWAEIVCYDWFEQLNNRFTASNVRYEGVDAGQIAWQLIDTTQSQTHGDLGITEGSIEVTTNRDRSYFNQNIMEGIINLGNVLSGFDFEITNDRVFNVYSVKGDDVTNDVVFEYGHNIVSAIVIEDFTQPCNRAIVLGEPIDGVELQRVDRNYTPSQEFYGLREQRIQEMDVSGVSTLNDKGDSVLLRYRHPLLHIETDILEADSPSIVDFSLGDLIRVRIKSGIYDIDEQYRVFEWLVEVGADNTEKLSLVLGRLGI